MTERERFIDAAAGRPARKAPYTFVDNGRRVLPSPVPDLDLSRPVADAVSGSLTVQWTTTTPLLVGGGDATDLETERGVQNGLPLKIEEDRYAIPGSSLKGLIRSVMEILTYARLSFIDDFAGHTHSYTDKTWQDVVKWSQTAEHKGGWLFHTDKGYELIEAQQTEPIFFDDFLPSVGMDVRAWHLSTLDERLTAIAGTLNGLRKGTDFGSDVEGTAQLVMSGPTPSELIDIPDPKSREYLFFWPDEPSPREIETDTVRRFLLSLNRDTDRAEGANFLAWTADGRVDAFEARRGEARPTLKLQIKSRGNIARYGLPVFWRNPHGVDQKHSSRRPILSLTALFRVAYARSVHDMIERSQDDLPEDQLDFVQALLGWAPPEVSESDFLSSRNVAQKSLRSRVKFGFAIAENARQQRTSNTWAATRPKPSYWPYYLKAAKDAATHPIDYNNQDAVLAGRKRYPARNQAHRLPSGGQSQAGVERTRMESNVTFLEAGATFTSDIRIHNVTPVELGALIWAITHGDLSGAEGYSHMLGRAKAYGYGQVSAKITARSLSHACKAGTITTELALQAFSDWMAEPEQMGARPEELEPIQRLRATAHGATGEALSEQLQWPRVRNSPESEQILDAYGELKQTAQTTMWRDKQGQPRSGCAGKPVADHPLSLPSYPRQNEGGS